MKQILFFFAIFSFLESFSQPSYQLFSSGLNISSPKGRGGFVDSDGNQLMLFSDGNPGSSLVETDICLAKLSPIGDVLWSNKYRIPNTYEEILPSVVENGDSYFVVGNSGYWPNQVDGIVLKVRKSDGLCLVAKTFGGASADFFSSAIKKSNTSFLVCGYSLNNSFIASTGLTARGDGMVIELNMNLDTLKTLRLGAYNRFDRFDHMTLTSTNDVLLVGVRSPSVSAGPLDNDDVSVVRLTSTLAPLWAKIYHHPVSGLEQPKGIYEGSGGRIFIVNKLPVANQTSVLKLSPSGQVIRSRGLPGVSGFGGVFSPGAFSVFGQKSSLKGIIASVDTATLTPLWSRSYSFGSTSHAMIFSLQRVGSSTHGFGFSHGITKMMKFTGDETGSVFSCDGILDNTFTETDSVFVDVTRTFSYLTSRFAYAGAGVLVETQPISLEETACEGSTLPVELVGFSATHVPSLGVEVSWSTASEISSDRFVVERSRDVLQFDSVGYVMGAGYSTSLTRYTWIDEDVSSGVYYYRLRSVDVDGSEEISDVVTVTVSALSENPLTVFPNPASLYVHVSGLDRVIQVVDATGKIVAQEEDPDVDVGLLPSGIYFLRSGSTGVRLVVEH